jgi:hypothetical protein
MVAAFCVADVALATSPIKPDDISGRWVSSSEWLPRGYKLTVDISRCGDGWCGVEVTDGSTCGRTVLRLDRGAAKEDPGVEFAGRIDLAPGTQPYVVRARLYAREGAFRISMVGDTGGDFQLFRRNYPFMQLLARSGDAVCRPDAKVS